MLVSKLSHYIYFDKKTGQILAVTNEQDSSFEHGLNVSFDDVEDFLTGKSKFRDFLIGYKKNQDGMSQLAVVPASDQGFAFKNNVFEWIKETREQVECIVTWNGPGRRWEFQINPRFADYYDVVAAPKLTFFVTLEDDFDFLIRTIFINMQDLILSPEGIKIPFENKIESRIDKISISSKLVFKSYGLRILNG